MPIPYIAIDNFRAFKEKTEFEFAPITILTGTNSSGKSSLVDALRILQNYTDEFVDPDSNKFWDRIINLKDSHLHSRIPDFKDLVNYYTDKESIGFEFKYRFVGMEDLVTVCLEFQGKDAKGFNGILKSLRYKSQEGVDFFIMEFIDNSTIHLEIDYGFLYNKFHQKIKKEIEYYDARMKTSENFNLDINPFAYPNSQNKENELIFRQFNTNINEYKLIKKDFAEDVPFYYKFGFVNTKKEQSHLNEILKKKFCIEINEGDGGYGLEELIPMVITNPVYHIIFSDSFSHKYDNDKVQQFLLKYFGPTVLDDEGESLLETSDLADFFYRKFIYQNICNSLFGLKKMLKFNYISSIRNSINRSYYKNGKESSFGNLLSDFLEKNPESNEKVKEFLKKYLADFNIGDEIKIERNEAVYRIDVYKQEKDLNRKINLIDLGYGISQVMPILLQILLTAFDGKVNTIVIEEPETNLHPALQSKLADMIIDANKEFDIQFIIETHSEYFIRRLQGLVANNKLASDKIKMYYFNHPDHIPEGEPQVYPIEIEPDGALSQNFGKGFYDEAATLNIALYNYSKEQHN